jgi:predicted nucleic acid-binding protein
MTERMVFIDASYWIALRVQRDINHAKAGTIAVELAGNRFALVSTSFVFAEIHARFSRFPNLRQAVISDFFENPIMQYESPTVRDQKLALDILRTHNDKSYSFCDAVSFVVMERMGLKRVVTFERHFEQFSDFEIIN